MAALRALPLRIGLLLGVVPLRGLDPSGRQPRPRPTEAAVQLAGSVQRDSAGTLRIPGAILGALQTLEIPSLRYVASDPATGAVAVGSTAGLIGDIAKLPLAVAAPGGFNFWDASGASERGYVMIADLAVGRLRVVVASPNLSFGDTMAWMRDEVMTELLPVLAPLFIGALLVGPFTIRRSLLPLDRLSAQAAMIEPARTDVRLDEHGVPSEILPLVRKINEALARIDEGFEQQRRFTSNAAHELRTPLAILRARIDGLEEGPTKSGLITDLERMSRLVAQLLLAGRLEVQVTPPRVATDLVEVARETVERMTPLQAAGEHQLKLLLPEKPVEILGDPEFLGDALRNLIENALAHSPAGAPVEIEVTPGGAIEVRDRGMACRRSTGNGSSSDFGGDGEWTASEQGLGSRSCRRLRSVTGQPLPSAKIPAAGRCSDCSSRYRRQSGHRRPAPPRPDCPQCSGPAAGPELPWAWAGPPHPHGRAWSVPGRTRRFIVKRGGVALVSGLFRKSRHADKPIATDNWELPMDRTLFTNVTIFDCTGAAPYARPWSRNVRPSSIRSTARPTTHRSGNRTHRRRHPRREPAIEAGGREHGRAYSDDQRRCCGSARRSGPRSVAERTGDGARRVEHDDDGGRERRRGLAARRRRAAGGRACRR